MDTNPETTKDPITPVEGLLITLAVTGLMGAIYGFAYLGGYKGAKAAFAGELLEIQLRLPDGTLVPEAKK